MKAKKVAVRLEGGIGDHLLGMRLLYFVRRRYPDHRIVIYSDCGGFRSQLQISRMSPDADEVVPVFQERDRVNIDNLGSLKNIRANDIALMKQCDEFLDAWPGPTPPGNLFIPHARRLDVSYYEILASRPRLALCQEAKTRAAELLPLLTGRKYVAINLEKASEIYPEDICDNFGWLKRLLSQLLSDPRVYILNIFSRNLDFPHFPEDLRVSRRRAANELANALAQLSEWHERIIPLMNERIAVIAAILDRCHYFLGVDNGIKHIAWALNVSRTFFVFSPRTKAQIVRWIPDFDRMSLVRSRQEELTKSLEEIRHVLSSGHSALVESREAVETHSHGRVLADHE